MSGVMARLANAMGIYSVPEDLEWDLFLGPAPAVSITLCITRSTGAAGWTGAAARSATWART